MDVLSAFQLEVIKSHGCEDVGLTVEFCGATGEIRGFFDSVPSTGSGASLRMTSCGAGLEEGYGLDSGYIEAFAATDVFAAEDVIGADHVTLGLGEAGAVPVVGVAAELGFLAAD
jgi:hypothetical protein